MKPIANNKKAFFDYSVLDDWEAGLVLTGLEINGVRAGRVTIGGSYIKPFSNEKGQTELWWIGSHFNIENGDQTRTKKVLLNRSEIERIIGKLSAGEFRVTPVQVYLPGGRANLKFGLASEKKKHDKRETLKKRDSDREIRKEKSRR